MFGQVAGGRKVLPAALGLITDASEFFVGFVLYRAAGARVLVMNDISG